MSTPHPLEEQNQLASGADWDPWRSDPEPHWYSGFGFTEDNAYLGPVYQAAAIAGHAVAKVEGFAGAASEAMSRFDDHFFGAIPEVHAKNLMEEDLAQKIQDDAAARAKALTPNPRIAGSLLQTVHGLGTGLTLVGFGGPLAGGGTGGAAALLAGAEGVEARRQAQDAGIDPTTANILGLESAATSAAGVLTPGLSGVGKQLITRLLTGATANVGFGAANRYLDHVTLERAGYPEMAAQQRVLDTQAIITDALLGAGFGAHAHYENARATTAWNVLRAKMRELGKTVPGLQDEALATNLANKDAQSAPGIPADPAAAAAHQAALEQATKNLLAGERVDVSATGVDRGNYVDLYHGSPYEFTAFDMSKLGTGEGGDLYGPGIYLAENRAVAQTYKSTAPFIGRHAQSLALDALNRSGGDIAAARQDLHDQLMTHTDPYASWPLRDAINNIEDIASGNTGGNLYTARVPREAISSALDLDKPLAEQPEPVRAAAKALMERYGLTDEAIRQSDSDASVTGEDLYLALAHGLGGVNDGGKDAASAELERLGVTGLRFLDKGSRGAREGTRNMVLFNAKHAQIAQREGDNPWLHTVERPASPQINVEHLDPMAAMLVRQIQDSGLLEEEHNVAVLENALATRLGQPAPHNLAVSPAPLRPEGSPSSPSPTPPVSARWFSDRGAMPGEPAQYLDVQGDDLDTAKAAIIERPIEGSSNAAWEAVLPDGQSLGVFDTEAEAGRFAEHAIDRAAASGEQGFTAKGPDGKPVARFATQEQATKYEQLQAARAAKAGPIDVNKIDIAPAGELNAAQRAIEQRLREWIAADPERAFKAYAALDDSEGGRILNTDVARELSPDYLADRTQSQAVHEPASWVIKQLYARALEEPPQLGRKDMVLFMAGGTGAGKTSAVGSARADARDTAHVIYDTNLATFGAKEEAAQAVMDSNLQDYGGGVKKIEQARKAGKAIEIVYIHRDPIDSLVNGALTRAMKQEAKFGSGRTVPIVDHIKTHFGANEAIRQFERFYAKTPDVSVGALDNSRGVRPIPPIAIKDLPRYDFNDLTEKARQALEDEYKAGHISEAVYRGFKGESPAEQPGAARGQPGEERAGGQGNAVSEASAKPDTTTKASLTADFTGRGDDFWDVTVDPDTGESSFKDLPYSGTQCTGFAMKVLEKLGRARVKIKGFFGEENPSSEIGQDAGGHDFAVADGRYIVDGWLGEGFATPMGNNDLPARAVFDLEDPADKAEIDRLYGDQSKWKEMTAGLIEGDSPLADKIEAANAETIGAQSGTAPRASETNQPKGETSGAKTETVYTAAGRTLQVTPRIVEAASLRTSDAPGYPQELQPRQRGDRTALAGQVEDIARQLRPEMLGSSAEADRGAPITGPDSVVESGNGRVMALRRVYAELPEKAAQYRAFLEAQGHDLTGFKEPILVRERQTPLTPAERTAFTGEANVGTTAVYSPVEQAQADARFLDAGTMAQLHGADLTTYQNVPFLREFVAHLPVSERSSVMNPDGTISQAGIRRVQAAILGKAYAGDRAAAATLGRILESTDQSLKSSLNAMVDAAPAFAKLRQMIDDGVIGKEYDIAPAIVQAIEDVAKLRASGSSLAEHLAQADMFSPKALATKVFYDKSGERLIARDKAAAALIQYADRAMAQRLNQGNLFGDEPASPVELLREERAPKIVDMFGLRNQATGEPAEGAQLVAIVKAAMGDRPNMEVPDVNGDAQRVKALAQAIGIETAATDEKAQPVIDAAVTCASRRGA